MVGIVNAREVQNQGMGLSANIAIGNNILYSTTVKQTSNPNWNELAQIQLHNVTDVIIIYIYIYIYTVYTLYIYI